MNPIQYVEIVALMCLLYIIGALLVFWWIYWITVRGIQIFGTSLPDEAKWTPEIAKRMLLEKRLERMRSSKNKRALFQMEYRENRDEYILAGVEVTEFINWVEEIGYYDGRDVQIPIGEEKEIRRLMR